MLLRRTQLRQNKLHQGGVDFNHIDVTSQVGVLLSPDKVSTKVDQSVSHEVVGFFPEIISIERLVAPLK